MQLTSHSYSGISHSFSTELAGWHNPLRTSQAGYVSDQLLEPNGSLCFSLTHFLLDTTQREHDVEMLFSLINCLQSRKRIRDMDFVLYKFERPNLKLFYLLKIQEGKN